MNRQPAEAREADDIRWATDDPDATKPVSESAARPVVAWVIAAVLIIAVIVLLTLVQR